MLIAVQTHLKYSARLPCNLLLQIEAAEDDSQVCHTQHLETQPDIAWRVVAGEENIGVRRWGAVRDVFDFSYQAQVRVDRPDENLAPLNATPLPLLPGEVTKFLMPSRYCHPEAFLDVVPHQFGNLSGGALVLRMSDWIAEHFTYDNGASHASTSATDSFNARAGVCRDYAHVLIAMARSVGIPARMVSCYSPDVQPEDFHAVAEVFLDGRWHLVDPTGMAQIRDLVRIGVGRDAADVSFLTTFGWVELTEQSVRVSRVE